MTTVSTKISSKFNIFPRRWQFKHLPVHDEDVDDLEDFQTIGSKILKEIIDTSESTTIQSPERRRSINYDSPYLSNSGHTELNLHEMSRNVSNIQKKEQEKQQRMETSKEKKYSSGNERYSNKVKRLKHLKRTIELARRKMFENKGSFAINMVTYREHIEKSTSSISEKGDKEKGNVSHRSDTNSIRGWDDRSRSSVTTCVTNDFTLQVIDEEIVYKNVL